MLKISIPTACHQDWNVMTPNEQGRHCNACAKTVVDFTSMSDEAVKHFFINKKEENVCGRFHNQQLHRISIELPQNIFYIPMPVWKKFLVASLIVFSSTLFSCDTTVKGEVDNTNEVITGAIISPVEISPAPEDSTTISIPLSNTITVGGTMPIFINSVTQGDVMIAPEPLVSEVQLILQADADTIIKSPVKTIQDSMGVIELIEQDTIKTKNPPKVDSINCKTKEFY
ncbi:hypothetical protein [Ferruginibacter sp.]|nr:hypothetical protein [Ferruginibacter sp.]